MKLLKLDYYDYSDVPTKSKPIHIFVGKIISFRPIVRVEDDVTLYTEVSVDNGRTYHVKQNIEEIKSMLRDPRVVV